MDAGGQHATPPQPPNDRADGLSPMTAPDSATASLYDGSGTYGLHSATWKAIRAALRKLGGSLVRERNNHNSLLMAMPTGRRITVGKAEESNSQVLAPAINQLMREIRDADIAPALFLAMLDRQGCAWNNKPPLVTEFDAFLRHTGLPLHNPAAWKRAAKDFGRALDADDPTPEPTKAPEPEAPADEKARAAEPNEPILERAEHEFTHPFTTAAVLDLVGLTDKPRYRATWLLTNAVRRPHQPRFTFMRDLLATNDVIRVYGEQPTGKRRKARMLFSERAAERVAAHLADKLMPATKPADTVAQEAPVTQPAPQPAPAPAPEPAEAAPPVIAKTPQAAPTIGAALLRLCAAHGIDPVFSDGDDLTIDLHRTVFALSASIH